jgi:GDP-L-fucose synthase
MLAGRRVLVTGGAGFLGRHVVARLRQCGVSDIVVPRSSEWDLTEQSVVRELFRQVRPDIVLHLAARVGGIGTNQANPGLFFYANMAMGLNVIEESRRAGVKKLVVVGTTCAYPKYTPVPFREEDLWNGYPEETNAPYGVAKRALLVMLQAYRQQYGLCGVYLIPANLYGPGDNFDLETSHVIPAMIRKFVEAKAEQQPYVQLWGTGRASREFLYVEDCAEGIVLAAEHYDGAEPVNLGTGSEIMICDLAEKIRAIVGYEGQIVWDSSRPDGQPRRRLETSRAREAFGFVARTPLEEGLRRTVKWYLEYGRMEIAM